MVNSRNSPRETEVFGVFTAESSRTIHEQLQTEEQVGLGEGSREGRLLEKDW